MARTARTRTHLVVLALLIAAYGGHYLVWCWGQPWYIEDAAISFAYARNLVEGEGLVPYAGGERVEGYSNPLWTFLMAFWQLLGVTPWISSKVMGFVFGALTLPLSWLLIRRALPEEAPEGPPHWALLAPAMLAASTQFVVWNDSGLENSLFNFLLAAGAWRLAVEIQDNRVAPWSALLFCGLAMTRPDGVAYALLGLVARLLGTARRRQWLAAVLWIVAFSVPFGLYHWWRYDYFAWPFPATYYAKKKNFQPFNWTAGGWKQLKSWVWEYAILWFVPALPVALVGLGRRRRWVILGGLLLLALLVGWNGRDHLPARVLLWWSPNVGAHWSKIIVWYLLGAGVVLGLATLPRRGWEVRAMLWASLCTGVFFWVWSFGDWMKGYRWGSQISVPLFTLFAMGIGRIAEGLPQADRVLGGRVRFGTLYGALLIVPLVVGGIRGSYDLGYKPETSPNSVHRRVNYMAWVQRRLHLERITQMDVDMGAHMWWSGWKMVDMAGLVDIPIAMHDWEPEFTDDYVFRERLPEFSHVHGSWANTTKIPRRPMWKQQYFEIPGYPTGGRTLHVGCHVRKDLLWGTTWDGTANRAVHFETGLSMAGWDVPAPEIAAGGKLYVDTGWYTEKRTTGFRLLLLLAHQEKQDVVYAVEVAPGYDWYRPEQWKGGDIVWGRWSAPISDDLPTGDYELGMVVLDEATGLPIRPVEPAAKAARYMEGEWWSGQIVKLGDVAFATAQADEGYERGLTLATNGDCEAARWEFWLARRHVARNDAWFQAKEPGQDEAMVGCWLRKAEAAPTDPEKASFVALAREHDHRHAALVAFAKPLGERLDAAGDAASDQEDWQQAYDRYLSAMSVDPSRSWTRRKLEDVRDRRLKIGAYKPEKPGAKKDP